MINKKHQKCACHGGGRKRPRIGDVDPVTGQTFSPPAAPDQIAPGTYANGYDDPFAPGGSLNAAIANNPITVPAWAWVGLAGIGGLILAQAFSGGGRRR